MVFLILLQNILNLETNSKALESCGSTQFFPRPRCYGRFNGPKKKSDVVSWMKNGSGDVARVSSRNTTWFVNKIHQKVYV